MRGEEQKTEDITTKRRQQASKGNIKIAPIAVGIPLDIYVCGKKNLW